MSTKRVLAIVLVASFVLLAVGIGPQVARTVRALPAADASAQEGVIVPYPGSLTDEASQPVADGPYDFIFALYADADGGELLWTEMQEDVVVKDGTFDALLGSATSLPQDALDGGARWLEVAVRGPGEAEFTLLSPRQELSAADPLSPVDPAAPAALSCVHTHLGEDWSGNYGSYALRVRNTGAGDGLVGSASAAAKSGVYGYNGGTGYGVFGRSVSGYGGGFAGTNDAYDLFLGGAVGRINANEQDGSQLYLSSNADVIVKLDNDGGENHVFRVWDSAGNNRFTVDENGNCSCSGAKPATVMTANYGWRQLYAMESPEIWFEDLGTASLVNGAVTVTFDPVFVETVNLEEDYHVYVTPLCQEPVLLFVTAKTSTGFTVQGVELDGDPSTCDFDYRVAVKRLGYEDVRLAETDWEGGE